MSRITDIHLLQMKVSPDKEANLDRAASMISRALEAKVSGNGDSVMQIVVLPEFFNAPYNMRVLSQYAEEEDGPTCRFLSGQARRHGIVLVGGTIPESDGQGRFYNTSFIYGPDGSRLGRHRKVHLFDINMPGQIVFSESDYLDAGNQVTVVRWKGLCFGVLICFDVRFPEWARLTTLQGAELLIIPAAFNTTTGPLHWELALRSRAVDNQVFIAACSPARNLDGGYQAWGHSLVADPMGNILAQADAGEQTVNCRLDWNQLSVCRDSLPILKNRRLDLYEIRALNNKTRH